ncbi:PLP-dependent aspartate aminotransferase family protein [Providencia rettgeri]|uniref:PLP-dependent aspartate aminotransferase family protein n=1 Tax=Providencia rettgeri TaxID=587 RepID=A0AAW6UE92_PRORE|nr:MULTISPECIES: PLP-dependent aspartate aminotransferase family protein [Providencia]MBG5891467.1 aminotransferase class V-fold PLP-dependent enzyme [Providencia rettgeri]MDI9093550.1 PLP-dependent aspartate aminotransferase family protein [Providencia rettgeri]MDT2036013.1 PLP-dependent aspartate aminotransferase family protein [Providencia rettgeri]QLQ63797.1 aminotransferase class V-fold PLP-dependent enzyme [Providencia rettgeri]URR23904.1 PLP-dependent aspartate aminotransferase family p
MTKNIATILIHGGKQQDTVNHAIFPAITTASTFVQQSLTEHGEYCYSRCSNPTRYAYETLLAEIEGGSYATATASGVAASSLVLNLLPKDSHIIAMKGVYGGTFRLFERVSTINSGHQIDYVDLNNLDEVKTKIKDNTRLIWIESPTNPLLELVDINAICSLAKEHNILTCVDNTFATAWNQKPLELGADLVMLSASKYIGGHSDLIGGAVITQREDLASRLDFLKTTLGAIASPFDAYLALRGLKTLALRMASQCSNAAQVAKYLSTHPKVEQVYYPGLPSHPQYELCKKQMRTGGAVVTIKLAGDIEDTKVFLSKVKYFVLAESLGGVESMVNHSATMSHGSMTKEERESIQVFDTTLRLSVGIEDITDLLNDLENALS